MSLVGDPNQWIGDPDPFARIGKFRVAREFISLESEVCRQLFSQVIVIGLETNLRSGTFTYTAIAPHFAPIPIAGAIPEYTPEITDHGADSIPRFSVRWGAYR